ncbi:sulfatase [Catenovulum agarivorans DS-2]|uniref:Sulfatase n=1 Tax=Catenovulum agarivorans DS-2 TaxID=1328313 RepID=W7QU46_9ALTE|nr:sulfatase-like hydrolase/transferase [Catenovulum agarivorans]EWH08975.1 sulfatase [Catenovulum agarivorans DS-2]
MLRSVFVVLSCLVALIGCNGSTEQQVDKRPNIVFVLLDDLGYADLGYMPNSEPDIYTPSIDALANQGTRFSQAYVTHPYCGPSRAGIMTGRYQHEFGSQFNLADYSTHGIPTSETYFSTVLQQAGYSTGLVGKWHLGEEPEYRPNVRGFDYFYGMLGGGHVYHTKDFVRVKDHDPADKSVWLYKIPLMENDEYASEEGYDDNLYITDMLTDVAIDYIDRESAKPNPFFLFMSYNAPHTPEQAKIEDEKALQQILGDKAASDPKRLTYTAMVYAVDRGMQRIVEKLKQTGVYEDTLIVFLSDNGGRINHASARNTPLKRGKTSVYEGGIRVPMFWHWPNGNLPQTAYSHPVSALDFYPTFTALAQGKVPQDKQLDGKDILSAVRANKNARENEALYFMMHLPTNDGGLNQTAVVLNEQKWFTDGTGNWQYFDLSSDLAEQNPQNTGPNKQVLLGELQQWACGHIKPQWFDTPRYGFEDSWNKNNMPNWSKTFAGVSLEEPCN